jgi:hypothetical protein
MKATLAQPSGGSELDAKTTPQGVTIARDFTLKLSGKHRPKRLDFLGGKPCAGFLKERNEQLPEGVGRCASAFASA